MIVKKIAYFFNAPYRFPTLINLEARHEYLTQRVLGMITITLGLFLGFIVITWQFGYVGDSAIPVLLPLLLVSAVGHRLSMNGYWRLVNRLPTLMFLLIGMRGSFQGYVTGFLVFYVLAFLLSGMLVSMTEMVIVLALGLVIHYSMSFYIFHTSFIEMLPSIITNTGVFSGIGLLQWLSISIMNQSLAQSTRDPLTGLFNRGYFDAEMSLLQSSQQYPVSILVFDLNDLKVVNDRYGHDAGDRLLVRAARVIQESFRKGDIICRIGGDEFATLLPETDEGGVKMILERLQLALEQDNLRHPDQPLNLAIGTATGDKGSRLQDVFVLADSRMYDHKELYKRRRTPSIVSSTG